MVIIVGLGNPGKKFENTRHNAGFMVLDFFAQQNNSPEFEVSKKYSQALISEKDDILLVKPQTFMNESGRAISNLKFQISNLVVAHDDIDLQLGKIKFSKDSTSGGHKGVASIIQALGTKDFVRLKIGIATGDHKAEEVVLQKFSPQEQEILHEVIKKSSKALKCLIKSGLEKTMNEYNK
ncbi:MAG: aminoacyl-tRNA hydrolase [Candidatus Staskawiczbacteria bacterium RIFCSPHIGHO2_02_FULL_43_16]|uniref:Peptidyl-tRNA hydrolase n=1 Tax=Candidatus Staskawiczbacteria bacterium RIFCSPHIGHO2_01_FULL_41_41 TaxID=1802203 RepID=A0A1G2HS59_9BACT|nr:MAG: aminoacyl-tRNA hydrolase [Candidatus Staskawiczbacteria bacterium RIFCSPHIGHO2_01_FULL_41_41]OGZ68063.1 MAG: aminoacyl-tRNA hydrolase [Candidatus Staskawiczbacteria bacterium RIFCSPHIGHO2_02_FULL_43_16]OGZ74799.1 MAG: aminoacyl-tRNA hydrolase [Candidatus Staskawiczbacteria bacterium RIFCSPLOWO2_01_FULL_43_17b]